MLGGAHQGERPRVEPSEVEEEELVGPGVPPSKLRSAPGHNNRASIASARTRRARLLGAPYSRNVRSLKVTAPRAVRGREPRRCRRSPRRLTVVSTPASLRAAMNSHSPTNDAPLTSPIELRASSWYAGA